MVFHQPMLKNRLVKWVHLPQFSGWRFQTYETSHHLPVIINWLSCVPKHQGTPWEHATGTWRDPTTWLKNRDQWVSGPYEFSVIHMTPWELGWVLELAKSGDFASVRLKTWKTWRELVARNTPWKVTGSQKERIQISKHHFSGANR